MKQKLLFLISITLFSLNNFAQSTYIIQNADCSTGCSDLMANFPAIQETSDYEVGSIPFNPPANFNGLNNSLFLNVDDVWSQVVTLPFNFNFFSQNYNQLIIGANGALSFDVSNAGNLNGWILEETLPNSTNPTLSQANIFGAGHDIDANAGDGTYEIGFQIFGTAPFRYFVVSFYNVAHFSCSDLSTTQMMVLYETTNEIDVYLQDKPICATWNNGNAVLGIQNPQGTTAIVPLDRNTGPWSATNEAWRFVPSGSAYENTYMWSNGSGQAIGTEMVVNVCPTVDEMFSVEITYYNPSTFTNETLTDDILIYTGLLGETPSNLEICSGSDFGSFDLTQQTSTINGGTTCSAVNFYESLSDAEVSVNPITNPNNYTNTSNPQTIFVRVEDTDSGDFETTLFDLVVNLLPTPLQAEMEACGNDAGLAEFDLNVLTDLVTNGNTDYVVTYYASTVDAEFERNPLVSPFINTVPNTQTIVARVVNPASGCFTLTDCYLNVAQGANLQDVTLIQCDDESNDGIAEFDIVAVLPEIHNGQQNIELTFYNTLSDADNASNPISISENFSNTRNPQLIYVRGENMLMGCLGFSTIELQVEETIALTAPSPLTICDLDDSTDGFAQFNLNDKNLEILGELNSNDYAVSYYETQADAEIGSNALNSTNYVNVTALTQIIYARVENLSAGCFATTTLELVVDVNCPIGCEETVSICYGNDENLEYIYTSDDGSPITLFFTAGQMEVCCDTISVLDSDGTLLYDGNNNGNLAGLLFVSSGDTLTLIINSDGSVSCETTGYMPIEFNVYCLQVENAIIVNAFIDENDDAIFDDSEIKFNQGVFSYEVNNDGVINYVNSSYGSFIIPNTEVGNTYDVSFELYDSYGDCFTQTTTIIENVTPIQGETVAVNFPLMRLMDCSDIAVSLFSYVPPRPGQVATNYLVVENLGNIPVSGSVEFTHDALVTLNTVLGVDAGNTFTNTSSGFILNFNNLMSGAEEEVLVQLNVPTNLNIGDFITNSVVYNETDLDVTNNVSTFIQAVVNSYDPNDKTESHGPEIKLDDFTSGDYLYYTINFQNLGTAEALEIRVEDILDNQLDAASFKMLKASHDYTVTRVENALTWQFNAINLPSESMDEPNSHGYVYFKIKPLPGYSEGDIIANTADIYFDFNPTITTNTFETEFVANLSVGEFVSANYTMYPNPANTVVHFEFNNGHINTIQIQVYDVTGKLVSKSKPVLEGNKLSLNVTSLPQGLYFIELMSNGFKTIEKLIIQ